jgi:hypothetical protein
VSRRRDEPEFFFTSAELAEASAEWRNSEAGKQEAERVARLEADRAAGRVRFTELYEQAVRNCESDERFARRGLS